jgi:hypothetical protein
VLNWVHCSRWRNAFAGERKDRRFYAIVVDAIRQDSIVGILRSRMEIGDVQAVQPFFILDQDLLAGIASTMRAIVQSVRRVWPRFLKVRTMIGLLRRDHAGAERPCQRDGRRCYCRPGPRPRGSLRPRGAEGPAVLIHRRAALIRVRASGDGADAEEAGASVKRRTIARKPAEIFARACARGPR